MSTDYSWHDVPAAALGFRVWARTLHDAREAVRSLPATLTLPHNPAVLIQLRVENASSLADLQRLVDRLHDAVTGDQFCELPGIFPPDAQDMLDQFASLGLTPSQEVANMRHLQSE